VKKPTRHTDIPAQSQNNPETQASENSINTFRRSCASQDSQDSHEAKKTAVELFWDESRQAQTTQAKTPNG
jgi:hypothetical protein